MADESESNPEKSLVHRPKVDAGSAAHTRITDPEAHPAALFQTPAFQDQETIRKFFVSDVQPTSVRTLSDVDSFIVKAAHNIICVVGPEQSGKDFHLARIAGQLQDSCALFLQIDPGRFKKNSLEVLQTIFTVLIGKCKELFQKMEEPFGMFLLRKDLTEKASYKAAREYYSRCVRDMDFLVHNEDPTLTLKEHESRADENQNNAALKFKAFSTDVELGSISDKTQKKKETERIAVGTPAKDHKKLVSLIVEGVTLILNGYQDYYKSRSSLSRSNHAIIVVHECDLLHSATAAPEKHSEEIKTLLYRLHDLVHNNAGSNRDCTVIVSIREQTYRDFAGYGILQEWDRLPLWNYNNLADLYRRHIQKGNNGVQIFNEDVLVSLILLSLGRPGIFLDCLQFGLELKNQLLKDTESISLYDMFQSFEQDKLAQSVVNKIALASKASDDSGRFRMQTLPEGFFSNQFPAQIASIARAVSAEMHHYPTLRSSSWAFIFLQLIRNGDYQFRDKHNLTNQEYTLSILLRQLPKLPGVELEPVAEKGKRTRSRAPQAIPAVRKKGTKARKE